MRISIVAPVLNEAEQIKPFLLHLRTVVPAAEIIVVDARSSDGTGAIANQYCDCVIVSDKGRPQQMNAGAAVASGDVLWFLHADCAPPLGADQSIIESLTKEDTVGGCFRIRILRPEIIYRIHDSVAHYLGKTIRVRCGDHGIFVRKNVFDRVGGYRDMPIMEDVELFRMLHQCGTIAWLPDRIHISSRRHRQVGVWRYTFVCSCIVALYCCGFGSDFLKRLYEWLVPCRSKSPLPPVESFLYEVSSTIPEVQDRQM